MAFPSQPAFEALGLQLTDPEVFLIIEAGMIALLSLILLPFMLPCMLAKLDFCSVEK